MHGEFGIVDLLANDSAERIFERLDPAPVGMEGNPFAIGFRILRVENRMPDHLFQHLVALQNLAIGIRHKHADRHSLHHRFEQLQLAT